MADLFGGEENQRAHARQFIGLMRGLAIHFGTTIVLLAHPSLDLLPDGSAIAEMLFDYSVMRDQARACSQ